MCLFIVPDLYFRSARTFCKKEGKQIFEVVMRYHFQWKLPKKVRVIEFLSWMKNYKDFCTYFFKTWIFPFHLKVKPQLSPFFIFNRFSSKSIWEKFSFFFVKKTFNIRKGFINGRLFLLSKRKIFIILVFKYEKMSHSSWTWRKMNLPYKKSFTSWCSKMLPK